MGNKLTWDDIALSSFYIFILVFTFFTDISFNKFASLLLIGLIITKFIRDRFELRKSYINTFNLIFYVLFFISIEHQYTKFGITLSVGLLGILSFLLTIDYLKSLNIKAVEFHRALIGSSILIFSVATLEIAGGRYTFTTGAGGILSAFVILAGFVITFPSQNKRIKYLSYLLGTLLILLSIRGPILCALLFILFYRELKLFTYLKVGIGILLFISLLYLMVPNSRIFDMHTSGRWIHWVLIWNNFEFNNFLLGMGEKTSQMFLFDHGVGDVMALPHNEFLRVFHDFGLIGLLLPIICLYKFMISNQKYLPFLMVFFIPFMVDNAFSYFFSFMFFVILSSELNQNKCQLKT